MNSKIKTLHLQKFTCFNDVKFDFCDGINLIMGQNGLGKTHLLKLLFALTKAEETLRDDILQTNGSPTKDKKQEHIYKRFMGCFKPEAVGRLARRQQGASTTNIFFETQNNSFKKISFSTRSSTSVTLDDSEGKLDDNVKAIYLPPREMLSAFEGFTALYEKREISMDETYYFLAKALSFPTLRGATPKDFKNIIDNLEACLGGKVIQENNRFYIKQSKDAVGKIEASLSAEGLRKIATLLYLVANGELMQNSILFWDEPESNLNPALSDVVLNLLLDLSKKGVQVFLATHDYLISQKLSVRAEYKNDYYKNDKQPAIRFFNLYDNNGETAVEVGDTLNDIQHNAILDEFLKFYDLEQTINSTNLSNALKK
jgi:ABC-type lipoprotein export system ATPase subunit